MRSLKIMFLIHNRQNHLKLVVMSLVWDDFASWMIDFLSLLQGSELSGWATGHFTEDGFDIFQNFPDLSKILWDAEDKGMVPKITPNHHVSIPEDYEDTYSVRRTLQLYTTTTEERVLGKYFFLTRV